MSIGEESDFSETSGNGGQEPRKSEMKHRASKLQPLGFSKMVKRPPDIGADKAGS